MFGSSTSNNQEPPSGGFFLGVFNRVSKKRPAKKASQVATSDGAEPQDKSPFVPQDKKLRDPLNIRMRFQLLPKQQRFVDTAMDKKTQLVLCDGIWGSSKTYLSVLCALQLLSAKRVSGILYIRSPVEAGAELGFIPGTLDEKMSPYAEPFYQKLNELLDVPSVKMLETEGFIEIIPPGFMRGQSWNNKAVIVDEAANFDRAMLTLTLSRIGPFCKVFVIGSHHQSDTGSANGFVEVFNAFNDDASKAHGIHTFEFNEESDIVRSEFVKFCMRKLGVLPSSSPLEEPMFPS
jgi:phosphate starvation-inducible protein PhoH